MAARKYANYDNTLPTYDKNKLGDMIVGIKAALITGYKNAKPAGWELLYESIANTADTSKRIVIRSKAVDSEQKVFEITDISNTEGSIKCWDNWQSNAGVTLLMQVKINKAGWGGDLEIVANDKFVNLVVNAVYHGFGDVDVFDSTQSSTLLFNMTSSDANAASNAIASNSLTAKNQFRDVANNRFVCRSFGREADGYSSRINYNNTDGDLFMGGDAYSKPSGILSPVRKTELLQINGNFFKPFGYLPMLCYTDNPVTMQDKKIPIDGVTKKIIKIFGIGAAWLPFAVDA